MQSILEITLLMFQGNTASLQATTHLSYNTTANRNKSACNLHVTNSCK